MTGYLVERGNLDPPYDFVTVGETAATTLRVAGLRPGDLHLFRIRAVNAVGSGAHAETPHVQVPWEVPPDLYPPVPRPGAILIGWRNYMNRSLPVAYRIERSIPGRPGVWTHVATTSAGVERYSYLVKDLTNGLKYYVRVGAVLASGRILWAPTVSEVPRTVPGVPRSPFIVAGFDQIGVDWEPPASNGGAPVTGYRLEVSWNGTNWSRWSDLGTSTDGGPLPLTDTWAIIREHDTMGDWAKPGRRLYVRVAAVNDAGVGPYVFLGSAVPFTYPNPPDQLRGAPGSGAISLSWRPPTATGYRPIAHYTIELSVWGSNQWRRVATTTNLSYKVTGLVNGGHYCVRVVSWNTGGLGHAAVPIAFYAGSWRAYDPYGQRCSG